MKERIHLKKMGSFFYIFFYRDRCCPCELYQPIFVHVAFHFQPTSVILDI